MPVLAQTTLLPVASNVFMTFAGYARLRELNSKPWWVAAFVGWGIALAECMLMVPANRIGYTTYSLAPRKIVQELITLSVFALFAVLYMLGPLKLDGLWAALCLVGAVYFTFRSA